jgi:N6-adenosine-specific RNA methylase IME4
MIPFPDGPFDIIYADPSWDYKTDIYHPGLKRVTMHHNEHFENTPDAVMHKWVLPAAKDCLLFMWTTSPFLTRALELGKAWGFKYITVAFCWDKQIPVVGNYTMSQVELCLVFKKGKIPQPRGTRNERQFLSKRRSKKMAEKPDDIADAIRRMFPESTLLEMFARKQREGWEVWGNEV